ncbi:reverse transcriptase domain-containing protein [Tanacetum coccineum]
MGSWQASTDFDLKISQEKSLHSAKLMKKCTKKSDSTWTKESDKTGHFKQRKLIVMIGMEFTYALRFKFDATNNEAEYEALIAGLRIAEQMGVKNLQANVDSRLVANQVNRTYIAKEPGMIKYLEKAKTLTSTFKEFSIKQVPRGENKKADALSKMASTSFAHLRKQVLVEELKEKSIDEEEVLAVVEEEGHTWMTPIHDLLGEIISDNGKPFRDNPFKDWCEKLCIRQCFASVKHSQANGLVERANRRLGEGIEASNEETPFSLTYGTKAVILVEIGMPTLRTTEVDMIKNDEALEINFDLRRCRNEMGRGLAQRPVIIGVSHDFKGDYWGCVPRSLFWREDLDGDEERGFDCLTFALVSSKGHHEGFRASRGGFLYW